MDRDDEALAAEVAESTGIARDTVDAILADQREYLERVLRSDGLFFAQTVLLAKRGSDPLADYLLSKEDPPVIWEIAEAPDEEPLFDLADLLDPDEDVVLTDFHGVPRAVVPVEVGAGRTLDTIQTAFYVLAEDLGYDGDDVWAVLMAYWTLVGQDGRSLSIKWEKWSSEEALEDWLVDNLGILADFGLDVTLWSPPTADRSGRQYTFKNRKTADLICRTPEGDWLVIELKAGQADRKALKQVRGYMQAIGDDGLAGPGEGVAGLVVSDGATAEFLAALGQVDEEIYHLNSGDIDGFVQHCRTQANPRR